MPGLTYEDAQGNHLYVFGDNVRFPKPHMLLADRRLATTQPMRSRAYFDYINELVQQHAINGFWNHRQNFLPPADYKLYNSFPIVSFDDGRPIDARWTIFSISRAWAAARRPWPWSSSAAPSSSPAGPPQAGGWSPTAG